MAMILTMALFGLPGDADGKRAAAPFPPLPAQAARTITELQKITRTRFLIIHVRDSKVSHERFQELLSNLEREIPKDVLRKIEKWKGQSIEKSLILMARDHVKHPERYRELVKTYGRSRGGRFRVQRPPALEERHLKPEYRFAWESLLLAPRDAKTGWMESNVPSRIVEALGAIQHKDSLPVLEKVWEASTQKDVLATQLDYQDRILLVLYRYANALGLRSMLKCLSFSDRRSKGKAPQRVGIPSLTLRQWALRYLSYAGDDGKGKQWREVLRKFPKDNLSKKDKQFVEEALAQLEKNLKATRKP